MENHGHTRFVTSDIVRSAILAGCSYVLMFFSFPIIPLVPYMKIDFSDLPVLIGTVLMGPIGGVIIAAVKSLLYWVTTGASIANLIGVGSSFAASIILLESYYYFSRWTKNRSKAIRWTVNLLGMAISLMIFMSILNWLVVTPLYLNLVGLKLSLPIAKLVVYAVAPFNLIKGVLVGGLFEIVVQRVLPRLKS